MVLLASGLGGRLLPAADLGLRRHPGDRAGRLHVHARAARPGARDDPTSRLIADVMTGCMIANPLADPLFWRTALTLGSRPGRRTAAGAGGRAAPPGRAAQRTLFQRWAVWAIIAPLFSLAVLSGRLPMLVLVGADRLAGAARVRAAGRPAAPVPRRPVASGCWRCRWRWCRRTRCSGPAALPDRRHASAAADPGRPGRHPHVRAGRVRVRVPAAAARASAADPRLDAWWPGLLLVLGLATALSDVGAFTVGKLFGRHRLSPVVSPNKTWEGVIGNVLGAALGTALLAFALPPSLPLGLIAGAAAGRGGGRGLGRSARVADQARVRRERCRAPGCPASAACWIAPTAWWSPSPVIYHLSRLFLGHNSVDGHVIRMQWHSWTTIPDLIVAGRPALRRAPGPRHPARPAHRALELRRRRARHARAWPSGWRRVGVGPGDRVMVLAPNSPELVLSMLGAWAAGAILVPIDLRTRADVMARIAEQTAPQPDDLGAAERSRARRPAWKPCRRSSLPGQPLHPSRLPVRGSADARPHRPRRG